MRAELKHVQKRPGGSYRYRRKVPASLRNSIGKGEIVIPLGWSRAEGLKGYARAHAQAERQLEQARRGGVGAVSAPPLTSLAVHRLVARKLREMGIDLEAGVDEGETDLRVLVADGIEARYPEDPATGYPIDMAAEDAAMLRMLRSRKAEAPKPTLDDSNCTFRRDLIARALARSSGGRTSSERPAL